MKTLIRFHQLLWILVILSSCYAPDLEDCTVSCTGAGQCASGQVCTASGFCAGSADGCPTGMMPPPASEEVDAGPPPVERVMLHVQVMGEGEVAVDGAMSCSNDCMISVPKGTVHLTATSEDKDFERWTSPACAAQPASCVLLVTMPLMVAAKFH